MTPTRERKREALKKLRYLIALCLGMRKGATPDGWMDSQMRLFHAHLSGIITFVEDVDTQEDKKG